jgi:hypothetical protein
MAVGVDRPRISPVATELVGSYPRPITAEQVLRTARTILLIDFPSREVPNALDRAGLSVMAHGGPGPQDFFSYEPDGEDVREVRTGRPPTRADLVYVHRPEEELPSIVADARNLESARCGAKTDQIGRGK